FNQRKRNRIPLKSVPGENEFFSPSEYMASTSSAAGVGPSGNHASTTFETFSISWDVLCASDSSPSAPQSHQWNRKGVPEYAKPQQYGNRAAPGPSTMRTYAPIAHPYKAGAKRCFSKESVPAKQPMENSLRILTTVINGMRHWSQFKDKIPYLFEIFATLDSAVTLGLYGAKSFLLRDGKDVLQCVFYENEQPLPRLIRGQVHRCVGNYDRSRDVLICVSVRAAQPSEQRNALEAVKVSDAEMRALAKILSEV
uniref:Spermatogenesis associated 22 n=1 Tax=Poecilia latipinna TaxID=48699 RepID=A0A3B3UYG2_9TELE